MIGNDWPFYVDCGDRKCLRQANQVRENHWNTFCHRGGEIISRVGRWYKLHTLGVLDRISSLMVIGDTLLRAFIGHTSTLDHIPHSKESEILRNSEDKSFRQL
jgi:hypothetical protein